MGQACCSGASPGGEPELGMIYPAQTLNGKTYSARQIWIIVRIQTAFRMWLAKRKVQKLRYEIYGPNMHQDSDEYNNINVQVIEICFQTSSLFCHPSIYHTFFTSAICHHSWWTIESHSDQHC